MHIEFSRALKLLRKEKRVSQRVAAEQLGVSQALLSHYENGAREPGLPFLVKACDYYDVSADYLIGRTMVRDGGVISPEALYDVSAERDNRLKGSAAALMAKRLLNNCIGLLFDLLSRTGHKGLISAVMRYLAASYYKVFRMVYSVCGSNAKDFFSVSEALYSPAAEAELAQAELQIRASLTGEPWPSVAVEEPPKLPEISHEQLNREYPQLAPSLFNVLHQVGDRIKKQL